MYAAFSQISNQTELIPKLRTMIPDINYPFDDNGSKLTNGRIPYGNIPNSMISNENNIIPNYNRFTDIPSESSFQSFLRPVVRYEETSLLSPLAQPNALNRNF